MCAARSSRATIVTSTGRPSIARRPSNTLVLLGVAGRARGDDEDIDVTARLQPAVDGRSEQVHAERGEPVDEGEDGVELPHAYSLATMPRQLAAIMAEYAEYEASRFSAPDASWEPTLFTRDAERARPRARVQRARPTRPRSQRVHGIVVDSAAAVTGLLLMVYDPEHLLVTTTDGATHIAATALILREDDASPRSGTGRKLPPGDEGATSTVNLLRARARDRHARRAARGARRGGDDPARARRAPAPRRRRRPLRGTARTRSCWRAIGSGSWSSRATRWTLATSHGRADKQLDEGVTLKRVRSA